LVVVSGAAFGIDTAAHRSALQVVRSSAGAQRSVTVAVLACGIDRAYPEANRDLLDFIVRFGSVVSEYPPGTVPARHRFLVRNRLIAAFGAGTVVVEAGRRSGTLSTAAAAEQLGRLVMAVPGPVTSAMSVGCHLLLADRFAQLVTGSDDVLAALGRSGRAVVGAGDGAVPGEDPRHPTDGLEPEAARVYDAFPTRGSVSVQELVVESGLPVAAVIGSLAVLQMHALADQDGPLWRRIRRERAG
jgi:DNA processing protein